MPKLDLTMEVRGAEVQSFPPSGNDVKCSVEFRQSTCYASRIYSQIAFAYSIISGIQQEAKNR